MIKVLLVGICIVELLTATPHNHRHRGICRKLLTDRLHPKKSILPNFSSLTDRRSETEAPIQKWSGGEFKWPCESTKALYKSGGKLNSKNVIATRGVMYNDYTYLALPRYKTGVPATLARIPITAKNGAVTLEPFPCWSLQEEGNCNALQSIVDIFLDSNDILWVLDSGIVNSMEKPIRTCPPKVVAFNLETGKIVKTVNLDSLTNEISRLQYVIADYSDCNGHVFIYVTDAANNAIIVFDVSSGHGYRLALPEVITGRSKMRDILHPSLIHLPDGKTALVFSYLSSNKIYSLRSDYLQSGNPHGKIEELGKKPDKMVILGTDNGSAMFFRYEGKPQIYRWNALTTFCPENFIKVSNGDDSECSLAMSVFPDYEINRMRILQANFPDFIKGTVGCGVDHTISIM